MWKDDTFNDIVEQLNQCHLSKANKLLENYLLAHPGHPSTESYRLYASHYDLLVGYWKSGYDDPQREKLFKDLLHRFYLLTAEMIQRESNNRSAYRMTLRRQALQLRRDWSVTAVKAELEGFVSDIALLTLEPAHTQEAKSTEIYRQHQLYMSNLFNYIWTSELWHTADAEGYQSILLSPTVDANDQALLVSAITLSALNIFDIHKFMTLAKVYQQTTDEQVRQRALVGWVFVADASKGKLYGEMQEIIQQLCEDKKCCQELAELQMQLVYCLNAEADTRLIKDEIMPDLLTRSHFKITPQGIEELDEDSLEEILHPDESERNMEKLEAGIHRMADMQQQGSDIYFGGFAQMKRFPFFDDVSNWFAPFYPQHPVISKTWNEAKARKFLHIITKISAFCDSDKYSFVLAYEQLLNHFPKKMLSLIEQGDAVPMPVGGEVNIEQQRQPAFVRRMYLQNLYRFFLLYAMRSEFRNPMDNKDSMDYLFIVNPLLCTTPLKWHFTQIASFLTKHKMGKAALQVLNECSEEVRDFQYYMLMGTLRQRESKGHVCSYYQHAVSLKPDNENAHLGLARALFSDQRYEDALKEYESLLQLDATNTKYELGSAICLLHLRRNEEALQKLYKLNYEHEHDPQIKRSLAWALTLSNKYDQAGKLYEQLLSEQSVHPSDFLNYGYLLWFQHHNQQAVEMFARLQQDEPFDYEHEFCEVEAALLQERGITDIDIQLMLGQLS